MKLTIKRPDGSRSITVDPVTAYTIFRMHNLSTEVRTALTAILVKGGEVEEDGFVYSISAGAPSGTDVSAINQPKRQPTN